MRVCAVFITVFRLNPFSGTIGERFHTREVVEGISVSKGACLWQVSGTGHTTAASIGDADRTVGDVVLVEELFDFLIDVAHVHHSW